MRIVFALFLILSLISICFAENKVYYDESKKVEIVDVSGEKSISELKQEYNCSNLKDITKERKDKIAKEKSDLEEAKRQENIEIKQKEEAVKIKLGLNDDDFANLRAVLK